MTDGDVAVTLHGIDPEVRVRAIIFKLLLERGQSERPDQIRHTQRG